MEVQLWPVEKVIPYARNARQIPPSAITKVASSLKEFGWRQPVVVDAEGVVVVGHTRLLAAQQLGQTQVPVHVANGLTSAQIKAYRLMDNRSHQESTWDDQLLTVELSDLQSMAVDLSLTGFEPGELESLLEPDALQGLTDEDAVPEAPARPVSKTGDLWLCGSHRVLCGDAVLDADTQHLLNGQLADLAFGDPPYNVGYEGYTEERLTIQNDKMSDEDFISFLQALCRAYRRSIKPGASLYVCHPSSFQREFQNAIESNDMEVRCQIIWAKNTFAWGHGRYKFQHEPIFYCHPKGQRDAWYGDKSQSTLWQEKKPAANRLHPTMKPVELVERALRNSSKGGDLVLDLFGGSGSTMIACERLKREARLMELDPKYVDVIVERWQEFTGGKAVLESTGEAFSEVDAREAQRGLPNE